MVEVVFAGDWHGNLPWATRRIQSVGASGVTTILHVGDFGLWPGNSGKRYLQVIEMTCARVGVELLVTPGNHEDWARLTAQWANPKRRDPESGARLPLQLAEHIQILPRGHRFTIGRTNFLSFGGAASVDRHLRTEGVDWWPEEMPSEAAISRRSGQGVDPAGKGRPGRALNARGVNRRRLSHRHRQASPSSGAASTIATRRSGASRRSQ